MRKLDLSDYTVRVRNEKQEWEDVPYEVKDSLVELLLARDLNLSGRSLLEHDEVARKIRNCADGAVLLEEKEWDMVVSAVETIKGLGRPDVDLVRRIFDAPEIKVEESK